MGRAEQFANLTGSEGTGHYVIGLTGNIATGKSTVLNILRGLGAYTIDADKVAHEVLASQQSVKEEIIQLFGQSILTSDGEIDRRALAEVVFNDSAALRRLEEIVHPVVLDTIKRLIEHAVERVVIVEAIKLIESGMHREYDALWVVTAPQQRQIERLIGERGLTEEDARLRVQSQSPQSVKVNQADVVIENNGSLKYLERQTLKAWRQAQKQFARSTKTS